MLEPTFKAWPHWENVDVAKLSSVDYPTSHEIHSVIAPLAGHRCGPVMVKMWMAQLILSFKVAVQANQSILSNSQQPVQSTSLLETAQHTKYHDHEIATFRPRSWLIWRQPATLWTLASSLGNFGNHNHSLSALKVRINSGSNLRPTALLEPRTKCKCSRNQHLHGWPLDSMKSLAACAVFSPETNTHLTGDLSQKQAF